MTDREVIEAGLHQEGYTAKDWREDGENGLTAVVGRFRVVEDDDDHGLYSGDEGVLEVCCVGAEKYRNQRACWTFTADGYDGGNGVNDLTVLEQAD